MDRGLGWVTPRGPFQPLPFCDSVIPTDLSSLTRCSLGSLGSARGDAVPLPVPKGCACCWLPSWLLSWSCGPAPSPLTQPRVSGCVSSRDPRWADASPPSEGAPRVQRGSAAQTRLLFRAAQSCQAWLSSQKAALVGEHKQLLS